MFNPIYNRIRYLISVKSGVAFIISHNYARIKVESYDSLLLEKTYIRILKYLLSQVGINIIFLEKNVT